MEKMNPQEIVNAMLAKGDTMLCIDTRHPEVQVPETHRGNCDLRLILNLGFRNPIHVLEDGVQADLLFSGALTHCWIPYESLWGVYSPQTGEGTVWPSRMPEDLLEMKDLAALREKKKKSPHGPHPEEPKDDTRKPRTSRKSRFQVIQGGKSKRAT